MNLGISWYQLPWILCGYCCLITGLSSRKKVRGVQGCWLCLVTWGSDWSVNDRQIQARAAMKPHRHLNLTSGVGSRQSSLSLCTETKHLSFLFWIIIILLFYVDSFSSWNIFCLASVCLRLLLLFFFFLNADNPVSRLDCQLSQRLCSTPNGDQL